MALDSESNSIGNYAEVCGGGSSLAKTFIATHLFPKTDRIVEKRLWQDPKSRFQELAQEHVSVTPTYELVDQSGPDHDRVFTIGVYLRKEQVATGEGRSKQEAEQAAAEKALETKGW
ncbi:MAG: putative dsRNA-binding protein [Candidatus Paceibacterota bacterium]